MSTDQIYHAKKDADLDKTYTPYETRRPPGYVPYLVDNLWEWTRPEGYPSRRHAKFGNPDPQEALRFAQLSSLDQVYRVEFLGTPKIVQMKTDKDARDHDDCRTLRKRVLETLDGNGKRHSWVSQDLIQKGIARLLFQPCLTKGEVDWIFDESDALRPHRDEIRTAVDFWGDVVEVEPGNLANQEGELIFGYEEGFRLRPIQ